MTAPSTHPPHRSQGTRMPGVVVAIVATVVLAAVATGVVVTKGSGGRAHTGGLPWGSCENSMVAGLPRPIAVRVDCATATMPLHHDDPMSPLSVTIPVMRLRAERSPRASIVVNPGGPGGSGIDYLAAAAPTLAGQPIARDFDIVSFDPRGVGRAHPAIRCRTDAERDAERAEDLGPYDDAGIARAEAENRDFVEGCVEEVGVDFLASVGTTTVARDLDRLRRLLGDERLTFLGYSYGTMLGVQYARLFPDRVRAMVFDGAVDTSLGPIEAQLGQSGAFQRAFDAFAVDCTARPGCPLGVDPSGALARYHQIVRPLAAAALRGPQGRVLTVDEAITATTAALYDRNSWRALETGLNGLVAGDPRQMIAMADGFWGRDAGGRYDNSNDAFIAIRCADDARVSDRGVYDRLDVDLRVAAPYADDGRGTGRGVPSVCESWPTPGGRPLPAPPMPRTLVVATTNDPATPFAEGVATARATGATLVTVQGEGHTASMRGNRCVDDAVNALLIDLTNPAEDLTC